MKSSLKFRKFGRMVLAFFSTIFLLIMLWIMVDCFTTKNTATKEVITYDVGDSIDYYVYLKENDFYNNADANSNNRYVTALMDYLNLSFDYHLVGDSFFNSDCKYNVVTELIGRNDGEVVWSEEKEVIALSSRFNYDVTSVELKKDVIIDLASLYEKANEFYELTGYGVELNIYVNIDNDLMVMGYDEGVNDERFLALNIPLTEKVVSIEKIDNDDSKKSVLTQYEVDSKFNSILFLTSSFLFIALLPLTVMSYISLFNLVNLDDYKKKLKRARRKCGYLINNVSELSNFKDKEIIEVASCDELIKVCSEKDLVINLCEVIPNRESWFYVIDSGKVYLFILTLDYREVDMDNNVLTKVDHVLKDKVKNDKSNIKKRKSK